MRDDRIKATSYLDKLGFVQAQHVTVWATWLVAALWLVILGLFLAPWGPGNWTWAIICWVLAVAIALVVFFARRKERAEQLPAATATLERKILPPLVIGIIALLVVGLLVAAIFLRDRWDWIPSISMLLWLIFAVVTICLPGILLPFQQDALLRRRLNSDPQFHNKVELVSARYQGDSDIPFSEPRLAQFDRYWIKNA